MSKVERGREDRRHSFMFFLLEIQTPTLTTKAERVQLYYSSDFSVAKHYLGDTHLDDEGGVIPPQWALIDVQLRPGKGGNVEYAQIVEL